MLFTYFVYWGLIILSVITGLFVKYIANEKRKIIAYLLLFLVIGILLGGRYEVGSDWENYKGYYEAICNYGISWNEIVTSRLEPLYLIINTICASLKMSTSLFFMTIVLMMMFLILYSTDKDYKRFHYVLFFFFTTFLASALNIQRQTLAACFFFLSVKYIGKDVFKYIICCCCAFFIHYSSVILFPFYFIGNKRLGVLENRGIMIVAYIASILFALFFGDYITSLLPMFISNEKYLGYLENLDINMEVSTGLGIMANHLLNIIVIFFSVPMIRYYKCEWVRNIYRCFIVGVLFSNIFGISMFLSRVPFALCSLKVLLFAYLTYFLLHDSNRSGLYKVVVGIVFIFICISMSYFGIQHGDGGISPYTFRWI